jgi:hypothetical protein
MIERVDGCELYLKFVYAMITPAYICFSVLERHSDLVERPDLEPSFFGGAFAFEHIFRVSHMNFVFTNDDQFDPGAQVSVLLDIQNAGGPWFGGFGAWRRIQTVLATLKVVPRAAGAPASEGLARPRIARQVLADNPWLVDFLHTAGASARAPRAGALGPGEPGWNDYFAHEDSGDEGVHDEVDRVFAELAAKRLELPEAESAEHFTWKVRGGPWTSRHKGCSYDCFSACASSHDAKDMCTVFSLATSASFSLRLYGEPAAVTFCEYWVQKHRHWFDIWQHFGFPRARSFEPGELAAFEEPANFVALAVSAVLGLAKRIVQLRALQPRRLA